MREVGLYVGRSTAMAATARGEHMRRQLGSGPLGWLGAVATVLAGRVPEGIQRTDQGTEQWCRGVLRGLGYDPDTHTLSRKGDAIVVRDHLGEPVKAYRGRALKLLQQDRAFLAGFAQEQAA